jgi:hypothetical protein
MVKQNVKHVVEKKAKNAQNTHHVAPHHLNVKHLVKVKNGEKQNKIGSYLKNKYIYNRWKTRTNS